MTSWRRSWPTARIPHVERGFRPRLRITCGEVEGLTVANVAPTVTLSCPSKVKKGQTATYTYTIADPGSDAFAFVAGNPRCGKGAKLVGISTIGGGSFQCKFVQAPAKPTVVLRVQDSDGTPSNVASKKVGVR